MKTFREFNPTDRYVYDFKLCTTGKGFAQVDTSQDAHYFGTWASPKQLMIVCYLEGDVIIKTADNQQEFADELNNIKQWNEEIKTLTLEELENYLSFLEGVLNWDYFKEQFKGQGLNVISNYIKWEIDNRNKKNA